MTVPTGGSAISVTNSGGGPTVVTVPAASYYLTAAGTFAGLLATLQAQLIASRPPAAGTWTVTMSVGPNGTGQVTIACTDGVNFAITWTDTNLRDILGFSVNLAGAASYVSPKQALGLWIPDCPLRMDGDIPRALKTTDTRTTTSPTGKLFAIKGNRMYRAKNLRWTKVPRSRTFEGSAVLANASCERFYDDVILSEGHSWFVPASPLQIYAVDSGALTRIGADKNISGWGVPDLFEFDPKCDSGDGWTGYWQITWPEIQSDG